MSIAHTRAIVSAALSGALDDVPTRLEPFFGLEVPVSCAGVPPELLDPGATWPEPADYERQARMLAGMFRRNFAAFEDQVDAAVREAAPRA